MNVLVHVLSLNTLGEGQCWATQPGYEAKCWATVTETASVEAHMALCHASYEPTINDRLLADRTEIIHAGLVTFKYIRPVHERQS